MTEQEFERFKKGCDIKSEIKDLEYRLDVLKIATNSSNLGRREAKLSLMEYLEPTTLLDAVNESIKIIKERIDRLEKEFTEL